MSKEKPGPLLRPTSVFTDKEGKPLLQLPAHWPSFPLNLYRSAERSECGATAVEHPTLLLCVSGCEGKRWHRENGKTVEYISGPEGSGVDVYGRDYQREWARWDVTPGYTLALSLKPEIISRLFPDNSDFDPATIIGLTDTKLQWLAFELLEEARNGAAGGTVYVESLSCTLIARLAQYKRNCGTPDHSLGSLSPSRRRLIRDFIEAHLGENVSITTLASVVGLTPSHFSTRFAASFGQPPHRYILQRRIEKAVVLLKKSSTPVVVIATDLGFASQSHFTQVLRRHVGMTPSEVRRKAC